MLVSVTYNFDKLKDSLMNIKKCISSFVVVLILASIFNIVNAGVEFVAKIGTGFISGQFTCTEVNQYGTVNRYLCNSQNESKI